MPLGLIVRHPSHRGHAGLPNGRVLLTGNWEGATVRAVKPVRVAPCHRLHPVTRMLSMGRQRDQRGRSGERRRNAPRGAHRVSSAPPRPSAPRIPPTPPWLAGEPGGSPPALSCEAPAGDCGDCGATMADLPASLRTKPFRKSDPFPGRGTLISSTLIKRKRPLFPTYIIGG
jgi:hypothetical protein